MASQGMAIMGSGAAGGDNRAVEAASAAISSPLLENIAIDGATGIIINVTGGSDLTLWEVNEASTLITEAAHEDAEIIFGAVIDDNMGDEVRVTVIATGFGDENQKMITDQISKLKLMAQANLNNIMAGTEPSMSDELNMNPAMSTQPTITPETLSPEPMSPAVEPELTQPLSTPVNAEPTQEAATDPAVLPRDLLMAKVKAFKQSQAKSNSQNLQPEQLTMNVDEAYQEGKVTETSPSSPFNAENLEIPSYLRKQQNLNDQGRS